MGGEKAKSGTCWGAGPVMSELGFAIARLKVPFTPGRKDKTAKECPAWDGPTCKEHCSGCANLRVSLSLSLSVPEDGRLPSADMGSPDKTATHLRLIFNRALRKRERQRGELVVLAILRASANLSFESVEHA